MYSLNISPPAGVVHADKAHPLPALGRRTSVMIEPNFAFQTARPPKSGV
jgi:hypothetical protein